MAAVSGASGAGAVSAVSAATLLRIQAHANAQANLRLHRAMAALDPDALHAKRTSFFPSLMGTLNHILVVDAYYIAALHGDARADLAWKEFAPADTLADLAARQRASDERLVVWCDACSDHGLAATVSLPRGGGRIQRDAAAHVLQHLFMHQTHHRGQVHAMLSGTSVKPPQLDEFLLPSEGHLRTAEMAALGWREHEVYGPAA